MSEETPEERIMELKPKINEFLYANLPGQTTINEMEEIACHFIGVLAQVWTGEPKADWFKPYFHCEGDEDSEE